MNTLTSVLSAVSSLAIAVFCTWAILSDHVHDRVVIKVGLILMALGFGAVALHAAQELAGMDNATGLLRAVLMINAGLAITLIGVVLRKRSPDPDVRRITDWDELDERAAG